MKITLYKKAGSMTVSVNALILLFTAAAFLAGGLTEYIMTILFVFAHEAGHISAAIYSGAAVYSLRILPVGFNAEIDDRVCSKWQRIFIYSTGPGISLLLAILFEILINLGLKNSLTTLGLHSNCYLAIFNLLPILPLDGGKIIMELLSEKCGILRAGMRMRLFSATISIGLAVLGLVGFINDRGNISLIVISLYILMCIGKSKEESAFMNIKNLLFRKSRVIKKGIYPVREIVVLKHVKLAEVIKACDYIDRFHIINVLDENLRVIKVMTEQELIDAIVRNTPDTTFENFMHLEYNIRNEI